jgi:hypothetical protein
LDHLAAFVETHSERLSHFLEALVGYRRWLRGFRFKRTATGLLASLFVGAATAGAMTLVEPFSGMDIHYTAGIAGGMAMLAFLLWMTLLMKMFTQRFHRVRLHDLDNLTLLDTQTRRDSWEAIEDMVHIFLEKTGGKFSLSEAQRDLDAVNDVYHKGAREIREAMYELSTLKEKGPGPYLSSIRDAEGAGAAVVSLLQEKRRL